MDSVRSIGSNRGIRLFSKESKHRSSSRAASSNASLQPRTERSSTTASAKLAADKSAASTNLEFSKPTNSTTNTTTTNYFREQANDAKRKNIAKEERQMKNDPITETCYDLALFLVLFGCIYSGIFLVNIILKPSITQFSGELVVNKSPSLCDGREFETMTVEELKLFVKTCKDEYLPKIMKTFALDELCMKIANQEKGYNDSFCYGYLASELCGCTEHIFQECLEWEETENTKTCITLKYSTDQLLNLQRKQFFKIKLQTGNST